MFEMKMETDYSKVTAKKNLLEEKLDLVETKNIDLSQKLEDKDLELQKMREKLDAAESELNKISQKSTNYQEGCKSAADHIAKLIKQTKDLEKEKIDFQEAIKAQKKQIRVKEFEITDLKDSYGR
jgi:chromosome segregation ATPase